MGKENKILSVTPGFQACVNGWTTVPFTELLVHLQKARFIENEGGLEEGEHHMLLQKHRDGE